VSRLAAVVAGHAGRSRAGARGLMADPAIASLAADARLLDLACAMTGAPVRPFRATLFDKSPRANWLVTWHQDTALPLRARVEAAGWSAWSVKAGVLHAHAPAHALEQVVALRVHLDDSGADNGPLRVLPGSHAGGVLSDAEIAERVAGTPARDCLVEAGGVLAMRPLLVHASSKASGPRPRRVLHIEYATSFRFEPGLELAVA
jgi:ectoine hydroxylase-related dioxygenase (phytanoyl-CoA dioxygenase family)